MMAYRRFSRKFVGSASKVELLRCLGSVCNVDRHHVGALRNYSP